MKLRAWIVSLSVLTAFATIAARSDGMVNRGDDIRFEVRLEGSTAGKAKYKVKPQGKQVQFEVVVEVEDLTPNTNYIVTLGPDDVWRVRTDWLGTFEMREHSIGPEGLSISDGAPVVVNDESGNTVLSGKFLRN